MNGIADKHTSIKYKIIYVGIAFLFAAIGIIGYKYIDTHRSYDWESSLFGYKKLDTPFGAHFLNEFLKEEWEGEIIHKNCDLDYNELLPDKKQKYNVLSFDYVTFAYNSKTEAYDTPSEDALAIVSMLSKGNNFIFATGDIDLSTFFGLDVTSDKYFDITDFEDKEHPKEYAGITTETGDTICRLWTNMIDKYYDTGLMKKNENEKYFRGISHQECTCLLHYGKRPVCVRSKIGKGYATFVGSNGIFSNYGVSREDTKRAIRYIIDNTFDRSLPLIIIYKDSQNDDSTSTRRNDIDRSDILDVLLNHPGTNLALTILLITFLLTLIFNSRRRRCAVEERKRERNSSINYTKHVASLYNHNSDYKELLITEQRMLLYNLRKEYRFDISTHSFTHPSEFAPMIAKSKSLDLKEVAGALRSLEYYTGKDSEINERLYIKCIEAIESLR